MKASTTATLRALREAGDRGITTGELTVACGPRYGARLHELDEDGYVIARRRESRGSTRYTLLGGPRKTRQFDRVEFVDVFTCRRCYRSTLARRSCCGPVTPGVVMQSRTDVATELVAA